LSCNIYNVYNLVTLASTRLRLPEDDADVEVLKIYEILLIYVYVYIYIYTVYTHTYIHVVRLFVWIIKKTCPKLMTYNGI
jgi:hypothetical protein